VKIPRCPAAVTGDESRLGALKFRAPGEGGPE